MSIMSNGITSALSFMTSVNIRHADISADQIHINTAHSVDMCRSVDMQHLKTIRGDSIFSSSVHWISIYQCFCEVR